jgi:hypothetical protein
LFLEFADFELWHAALQQRQELKYHPWQKPRLNMMGDTLQDMEPAAIVVGDAIGRISIVNMPEWTEGQMTDAGLWKTHHGVLMAWDHRMEIWKVLLGRFGQHFSINYLRNLLDRIGLAPHTLFKREGVEPNVLLNGLQADHGCVISIAMFQDRGPPYPVKIHDGDPPYRYGIFKETLLLEDADDPDT